MAIVKTPAMLLKTTAEVVGCIIDAVRGRNMVLAVAHGPKSPSAFMMPCPDENDIRIVCG
jgi:hypothetical protein